VFGAGCVSNNLLGGPVWSRAWSVLLALRGDRLAGDGFVNNRGNQEFAASVSVGVI